MAPVVVTWLSLRRSRLGEPSSGEEAFAAAEDDGVDHEPHLVDQVVGEQRPRQFGAADQVQIVAVFTLERAQCLGHVAVQQRGVRSGQRFSERGGRDVLRPGVKRIGERSFRVGRLRPVRREALVGAAPEQEGCRG
jgi:hypothetical protein